MKLYTLTLCLNLIDFGQTIEIVNNDRYFESNPILGSSPTTQQVGLYFGGVFALNYGFNKIPHKRTRKAALMFMALTQLNQVIKNHKIGIRINF